MSATGRVFGPPLGLTLGVVALLAVGGCGDDDGPTAPPPAYESVAISGPDTVRVGQSVTFSVAVVDTAGQPVPNPQLSWSSSSNSIATVSSAGVVSGESEGLVVITASGGGVVSNPESVYVFPGVGWVDQSDAALTLNDLNAVFFLPDGRTGWAVGALGTILRTLDGGENWTPQPSNSTGYTLNDVWFISPSDGFVVGQAGRVLFTRNSGTTWTPLSGIDSDGGKGLNAIWFQNSRNGWIVGNGGIILRTTNGGGTWTRVLPAVTSADLHDVSFPTYTGGGTPAADPYGYGWAVGAGGTIVGSDDFGLTWRIYVPFATTDALYGVVRRNTLSAAAVGANNRTLVTTSVADTAAWQLTLPPTPPASLFALSWPAAGTVPDRMWAGGVRLDSALPAIAVSEDAGATWSLQDLPADAPLTSSQVTDVWFIDSFRGWAVGRNGLILHTVTGGR